MKSICFGRHFMCLALIGILVLFAGCAGPLDTATKQALQTSYMGKTYVASTYFGSRYLIEYTNNSVNRRSPIGTFVDASGKAWYATDAGWFEGGTSGDDYECAELQAIDRDLNFNSFVQGIEAGQLVTVTKIDDKNNQIVFEVETVRKHDASKTYEADANAPDMPRTARLHFVLGKDEMKTFNPAVLDQLAAHLLQPVPLLASDAQKQAFILEHYGKTPVADLAQIAKLSMPQVLEIGYANVLSQTALPADAQRNVATALISQYVEFQKKPSIRLADVRVKDVDDHKTLELAYELQHFTNSFEYYSPKLRASLLFFKGIAPFLKPIGAALDNNEIDDLMPNVSAQFSYVFVDKTGKHSLETLSCVVPAAALTAYAQQKIEAQELADNARIMMGDELINVSSVALDAVEGLDLPGRKTWKTVEIDAKWDSELNLKQKTITVHGKVKNSGTWIAKNIKIEVVGKNPYGLSVIERSTTLSGLLRPGETQNFSVELDAKNVHRISVKVDQWEMVE